MSLPVAAPNVFDIAREAGVSKSTAARALSGHGAVSPAARARVLAAAEQLHYRANTVARSLRSGENRLLGVVVPYSGTAGFLSHIITAQKLEGLALAARELGYDLQIFLENLNDRDALTRLATERFVQGLFFFGPVAVPVLQHLEQYRIPWVTLNWQHRTMPHAPHVWTDFHHAGHTLAGHLFDQGCRRVMAFDWLSGEYGPFEDGITQAVYDRNLSYTVLNLHEGRRFHDGAPVLAELRRAYPAGSLPGETAPDGLLLGSAAGAIAAWQFFAEERPELKIGRDLAVTIFDDLETTAALRPALTAYAQNMTAIGRLALERLDRHLTGASAAGVEPAEQKVRGELRVRSSSTFRGTPQDRAFPATKGVVASAGESE